MDYQHTLSYLYNIAPMFQQVGSKAYKEGLVNSWALDNYFDHPHRNYRTIHVGGTNGKGSCSHTLAAILQEAGYRVGLYTSPHLVDFCERVRINGQPMSTDYVVEFVEKHRGFFEPLYPSFFELTTAMALRYFADEKVDVAIIEVGLGGRLDCTNIIRPDLSVITNISFDHTQFLGSTLPEIASEKAGIMKEGVPIVIGETVVETKPIFIQKAKETKAPIVFAEEEAAQILSISSMQEDNNKFNTSWLYQTRDYGLLQGELSGLCQHKNTNTILSALRQLKELGYRIASADVQKGFADVCELTGLLGRWQQLQENPILICDTGHNVSGISYIVRQLKAQHYNRLHIVLGVVNDKDIHGILSLLPSDAIYYFTQASVQRAMPAQELQKLANMAGLNGQAYPNIVTAVQQSQTKSLPEDFIFVGGSSFIVADLLANRDTFNFY